MLLNFLEASTESNLFLSDLHTLGKFCPKTNAVSGSRAQVSQPVLLSLGYCKRRVHARTYSILRVVQTIRLLLLFLSLKICGITTQVSFRSRQPCSNLSLGFLVVYRILLYIVKIMIYDIWCDSCCFRSGAILQTRGLQQLGPTVTWAHINTQSQNRSLGDPFPINCLSLPGGGIHFDTGVDINFLQATLV